MRIVHTKSVVLEGHLVFFLGVVHLVYPSRYCHMFCKASPDVINGRRDSSITFVILYRPGNAGVDRIKEERLAAQGPLGIKHRLVPRPYTYYISKDAHISPRMIPIPVTQSS